MSAQIAALSQWLALALILAAAIAGVGALLARSVFVMCMQVIVCAASASAALLLLRQGDAALALVLFGVAWAPLLILAAMLLSARAAKRARTRPWASLAVAAGAAGALLWRARDVSLQAQTASAIAPEGAFWLAPLVVIAAIAVIALLGFGERGAMDAQEGRSS